jgi:hypothetical protein
MLDGRLHEDFPMTQVKRLQEIFISTSEEQLKSQASLTILCRVLCNTLFGEVKVVYEVKPYNLLTSNMMETEYS